MNAFPELIWVYGTMAFTVGLPLGFLYLGFRAVRALERRGAASSGLEALATRVRLLEERVDSVEGSARRVPKR